MRLEKRGYNISKYNWICVTVEPLDAPFTVDGHLVLRTDRCVIILSKVSKAFRQKRLWQNYALLGTYLYANIRTDMFCFW